MDRIATIRFFCSHNCFQVFDATLEPWDELSELGGLSSSAITAKLLRGWYRAGRSLVYRTVADGNDHRIDVYHSPAEPLASPLADRVLVHNLLLPSGRLTIFGLDYGETISVAAGAYIIYCRAFNLGIEAPLGEARLPDDEFILREDLERYELVLVPGYTDREGVLCGPDTLEAFSSRWLI